jgi:hypothetical protein
MPSDSVKVRKMQASVLHSRIRFAIICSLIAANSFLTVVSIVDRRYPWGLAAVFFLIPCLLREMDLRHGRPLRRLGPFGWSCFIAGFLFWSVVPFLIL